MPKTHSTARRINTASEDTRTFGGGEREVPLSVLEGVERFDDEEEIGLVCNYFCRGMTVADIRRNMKKDHGIVMTRERPYKILSRAATRGLLKYEAPLDEVLHKKLMERYGALLGARVVHSVAFDHVAYIGAREIIQLLRWYKQGPRKKDKVHIGLAGGPSMRILARHLSDQLCRPQDGLPETLCLHALVSGFNPHDPTTDPNAFFTYFVRRSGLPLQVEFMGLHAPALVESGNYAGMIGMAGIKEAYEARHDIDIFITSGAQWEDEHSLFHQCMERSEGSVEALEAAGCIGDILWRPLGPTQPIEVDTKIRAMTLIELSELPGVIAGGSHVMLVLGACGGCDRSKGKLLRAVLDQENPLLTHLVADSRTVKQALDE